jgi:hypothetical protein
VYNSEKEIITRYLIAADRTAVNKMDPMPKKNIGNIKAAE